MKKLNEILAAAFMLVIFTVQAVKENFEICNKTKDTIYVFLINGKQLDYFPVASNVSLNQ